MQAKVLKAVREEEVKLRRRVGFVKQVGLSREWTRDEQSGESEDEEVMGEGISNSEMDELVPEWGWWSISARYAG